MKLPWKRYPRRDGSGLLSVLVGSSLLLMLAMTIAGTSFHHLSVSNRLSHAQTARDLAEAALGQAVAELMAKYDKYQAPNPLIGFQPVPSADGNANEGGFLTFDTDAANLATINSKFKNVRLEVSVNNFGSDAPITVAGRTLPGESAYLRAVGLDHGIERAMECILYIPKYPWAIAAGGAIKITGQSRIASVQNIADAADPSKELPGHLATNSNLGTDALVLEGNQITVTGDAQSVSGANFGANTVKGERRLNSSAAKIPEINVESYSTLGQPDLTTFTSSAGPNEVAGFAYRDGTLNFASGLKLTGGVLYVKGDITISGQISGEGAIISTGKVTIDAGGQVASNNKVAILSKGDLKMTGSSGNRLLVTGIVYSGGSIESDYTDVFGNTASPSGAGMTLHNTNVYSYQTGSNVTITNDAGIIPSTFAFQPSNMNPVPVMVGGVLQQIPVPVSATINPALSPLASTRFKDPATGKYMIRRMTDNAWASDHVTRLTPQGTPIMVKSIVTPPDPAPYQVPAPTGPAPLTNADMLVTYGTTTVAANALDMVAVKAYALTVINQSLVAQGKPPLAALQPMTDTFLTNRLDPTNPIVLFSGNSIAGIDINTQGAQITGNSTGTGSVAFQLDLNQDDATHLHMSQFISRAEKIRVLYWRDVLP